MKSARFIPDVFYQRTQSIKTESFCQKNILCETVARRCAATKHCIMELQIGKILRRRKLTQRWLAEAVDVSPGYMSSLVSNQKKPSAELIEKMAEALGIEPGALWLSTRAIPVAGRVGAGSQVELVDAYAKGEGLYKIACPSDLEAEKVVGVEVRGDSMLPIFASGDVILFTRDFVGVDESVIGQVCVLETETWHGDAEAGASRQRARAL